ncbi:tyrosine-type recombinase/integrase [Halobacterium salinarum]|uniref:tyrosine-type recombinase/integrase n=1 Tax=Halobacterium salinarum TaxID=2242 RepID=UPI0025562C67|nr:tyrosine-type recombinase/integrase [Halobacterium salinarum]MDL0145662.1 tyrosine-type recombinase/integrase [Halobacterium salinarum]
MTKERFTPLHPQQVQAFERTIEQSEDPIRALTGQLLLHTGIRNGEYNHMRPSWLSKDDGDSLINIPEKEECVKGAGPAGMGNQKQRNLNDRGEPCTKCRNKTHREENDWKAKTPAAIRTIRINSSHQTLIELLDWWKQGFNFIPLSHRGVNYHLKQLADEAGLDRRVTAHDLRFTHGMMLGRGGWTASQIKTRLGYSSLGPAQQFTTDPE